MPELNWGCIQDGGAFESLMHAILYAEVPDIILFGRPGKDSGQDARTKDGHTVYQAKYRRNLTMDGAIPLAKEALTFIKKYRSPGHNNYNYWKDVKEWVLVANFEINPNDRAKWEAEVAPVFQKENITALYWDIAQIEQKLFKHAHIKNVFFDGENRILVGLGEAYNLLTEEGHYLEQEHPMVGREEELRAITTFSESENKRVLPIVGTGGIGKTRLLYEGLNQLSDNGWRVFWALPESMSRSSHWFKLLNGNQPTCVAIDDPEDHGLLATVIEQLCPVERRNWKVLFACRSSKTEMLQKHKNNPQMAEVLTPNPLNEEQSKKLIGNISQTQADFNGFALFNLTEGIPGWLCLATQMIQLGQWRQFPEKADDIANIYVQSCLNSFPESVQSDAQTTLRWLALFGVLNIQDVDDFPKDLFPQGKQSLRDQLKHFNSKGLVRNWGVEQRLYAVYPLIVREHILSRWLLEQEKDECRYNSVGKDLVKRLVQDNDLKLAVEKILGSLTQLTRPRLDEKNTFSLFEPIFDEMERVAKEGDLLDQDRLLDLIEKSCAADPERALDVLIAIRENSKDNQENKSSFWGVQTYTHASLVEKLPWVLYQVANQVASNLVAKRILDEFGILAGIESKNRVNSINYSNSGKSALELLNRLLRYPRPWGVFTQSALDYCQKTLRQAGEGLPIIETILSALLDPEQTGTDQTSEWGITFTRRALTPGSEGWIKALELRDQLFKILEDQEPSGLRPLYWKVLAHSHHQFHRMVLHERILVATVNAYLAVLVKDLERCANILESPSFQATIEETTQAREMWEWYINYGRNENLVKLANKCEKIYNHFSTWRLHDFFKFESHENLAQVTDYVVAKIKESSNDSIYHEFFAETKRYLTAVRGTKKDGADSARIAKLAEKLANQFHLSTEETGAPLTSFVKMELGRAVIENQFAWNFTIEVCRSHIKTSKVAGNPSSARDPLHQLLAFTSTKTQFLFDLYSNAHPDNIGRLTENELNCILSHKDEFLPNELNELFILLGTFAMVCWETVREHLTPQLNRMRHAPQEVSKLMELFICYLELSTLRYKWAAEQVPTGWIVEMFKEYPLNGTLLEMYELTWLRDYSNFKMTMTEMVDLMRSRLQLEQRNERPSRILPYEFSIKKWVAPESVAEDASAFHEFCQFILEYDGFTAIYWIPKLVVELNPSGDKVKDFVQLRIGENATTMNQLHRLALLASHYSNTSEAWEGIAHPICEKVQNNRREERERIYFDLSKKETGVISSLPGEVPQYYIQERDNAADALANETNAVLQPYRKWALDCAKSDLKQEQERVEESATHD